MLNRLRSAWLIFQNWRRFRARMLKLAACKRSLYTGIAQLYPFDVGEECPTCHCIFDTFGTPLDWIRPGCHCVCHD
jgi:hypothetical protein